MPESDSEGVPSQPAPLSESPLPESDDCEGAATASASPSPQLIAAESAESEIDGKDSESECSDREGAATVSATIETFEPNTFGTLEDHVKSHAFPAHVKTCGPCRFWKHRWTWTAQASFTNAATNKKETWLACKDGAAICLLCAAYDGPGRKDKFAEGIGNFLNWNNIKRHGNLLTAQKRRLGSGEVHGPEKGINWTHELAVQARNDRARAEALGSEAVTASTLESSVTKHDGGTAHQVGPRAFLLTRVLLETRGSFRNFEQWAAAATVSDEVASSIASRWQCARRLETMAKYERLVTQSFLKAGSVHRLQADGLGRTYQVEIGTVVWRFPVALRYYQQQEQHFRWLTPLGDRGPWLVERVIGMHEFPDDMGCDGKVSMLETCVRKVAVTAAGDVNLALHSHVRDNIRVWTSDGADRDVGLAATGAFSGLAFHAWDESHSAGRLFQNALRDDAEIELVDKLLVTGKKPYSLAKFLSTSGVFRKKFGDAQLSEGVAFVRNFGWAPQRFDSRARPYARECRRWNAIWSSVAAEAEGGDKERSELAASFLTHLGGENSARLLLAGLLADLAVEHYAWVATGDKANPDTTTVVARAESFVHRLDVLFTNANILSVDNSYTGVTLAFLKENSYYHFGKRVQCFGIGDLKDPAVQNIVRTTLRRVQNVVANIKELLKIYRPTSSWFQAFAAFSLPSPMSVADTAARAASSSAADTAARATQCRESLERLCVEAKLPRKQALAEWQRLLPRAQVFHKNGCTAREAWGRASAEFPELKQGRALVELFLIWKTSTGNLERRFRTFREVGTVQRARLLDLTVEDCLIADQGPDSKMMRTLLTSLSGKTADAQRKNYFNELERLHEVVHGPQRRHGANQRAQRRDAGVSRPPSSGAGTASSSGAGTASSSGAGTASSSAAGTASSSAAGCPESEAAFARKRALAIDEAVAASPTKRTRMMDKFAWVHDQTGGNIQPSEACAKRVAKRLPKEEGRFKNSAAAAAKARAKREQHVTRSNVRPPKQRDLDALPARPAGVLLARARASDEKEARRRASCMRFYCTCDPVDFVRKAAETTAAAKNRGHVVLASPSEISDYAVCARLVAVLMGAYLADAKDFLKKGKACGCQYKPVHTASKNTIRVAVTATVAEEFPTLVPVLKAIAMVPGSCFEYFSETALCKFYKKEIKTKPRVAQRVCLIGTDAEKRQAVSKIQPVFVTRAQFLRRFEEASGDGICPGVR